MLPLPLRLVIVLIVSVVAHIATSDYYYPYNLLSRSVSGLRLLKYHCSLKLSYGATIHTFLHARARRYREEVVRRCDPRRRKGIPST
jgi:hypothetical protein